MKAFGVDYVLKSVTVNEVGLDGLIIDHNAQRDLTVTRAKEIGTYYTRAIEGVSVGAFVPPLVVNQREDGGMYVIDGQHRWAGLIQAIEAIEKQIDKLNKALMKKGVTEDERVALMNEKAVLKRSRDELESTQIPIMVYQKLHIDEERQAFHDMNNLAKKVPQSLALSYDSTDPFVRVAKDVLRANAEFAKLVEISRKGTKLSPDKVFLFATVHKALVTLIGDNKWFEKGKFDDQYELALNMANQFVSIVMESLPEDPLDKEYMYRDAKILQGMAGFCKNMNKIEGVDWAKTLEAALKDIPIKYTNHVFVSVGGAALQDGLVAFRGTGGGLGAVVRTFEALAKRLDSNGKLVSSAYGIMNQPVDENEPDTPDNIDLSDLQPQSGTENGEETAPNQTAEPRVADVPDNDAANQNQTSAVTSDEADELLRELSEMSGDTNVQVLDETAAGTDTSDSQKQDDEEVVLTSAETFQFDE